MPFIIQAAARSASSQEDEEGEIEGDKFVSSTGNNGNDGSEGSPYATMAFAMGQISAGQTVVVLNSLTENINLNTISGGSGGVYKRLVGVTPGIVINGRPTSGGGSSKYLSIENLHFNQGSNQADCDDAPHVKFIACGFFGGPSTGNNVGHLAGSDQLYENCYFGGNGGRYASLCFQQTNTLYRWCVVRTEQSVWTFDGSNPCGGIQIYSSTNCGRIQCIAVDCLKQSTSAEWLSGFNVTSNVGAATGIFDTGCIACDNSAGAGFQTEGSSNITQTLTECVAVRNTYGMIENCDSSGTITVNGAEFSGNNVDGIAGFGGANITVSNVNTSGNGDTNLRGVTNGGGNTTAALNMNTLLSAMKKIGVAGTLRGETGWNVEQAEDLFPFPNEDAIRTKYRAISARGFCADGQTLTTYLKRVA